MLAQTSILHLKMHALEMKRSNLSAIIAVMSVQIAVGLARLQIIIFLVKRIMTQASVRFPNIHALEMGRRILSAIIAVPSALLGTALGLLALQVLLLLLLVESSFMARRSKKGLLRITRVRARKRAS